MLPGRRTPEGALFVIQGPPPAGTPLVGGIAVSPEGVIYANGQGDVIGFSPIDLFQNNEQGAWYDPSDLSTMFQDSTGTVPVTADGQPVRLILDKSGNDNHATAPSDAARPLYKTDGTYHWLQFDGVDDGLSTAAIDFTSTDKISVFCGVRNTTATVGTIVQLANDSAPGLFFVRAPGHVADTYGFGICGSATQATPSTAAIHTPPKTVVISSIYSLSTAVGTFSVNINAVDAAITNAVTTGVGTFANAVMGIGVRPPFNSVFFTGNIYSLIVRGALSTAQEITDTETWVNGKTGAY